MSLEWTEIHTLEKFPGRFSLTNRYRTWGSSVGNYQIVLTPKGHYADEATDTYTVNQIIPTGRRHIGICASLAMAQDACEQHYIGILTDRLLGVSK